MRVALLLLAVSTIWGRGTSAGETQLTNQGKWQGVDYSTTNEINNINPDLERYKAFIIGRGGLPDNSETKQEKAPEKQWGAYTNGEETNKVLSNTDDGSYRIGGNVEGSTRPWYLASQENKSPEQQQMPSIYNGVGSSKSSEIDEELERFKIRVGIGKLPEYSAIEQEISPEKAWGAYPSGEETNKVLSNVDGSSRPWYLASEEIKSPEKQHTNINNETRESKSSESDEELERFKARIAIGKLPEYSPTEHGIPPEWGAYTTGDGDEPNKVNVENKLFNIGGKKGGTRPWYFASEENKSSERHQIPNTFVGVGANKDSDIDAELERFKARLGIGKLPESFSREQAKLPDLDGFTYNREETNKVGLFNNINDGLYSNGANIEGSTRPWYLASEENKSREKQQIPNTFDGTGANNKMSSIDAEIERLKAVLGGGKPPEYFAPQPEKSLDAYTNNGEGNKVDGGLRIIGGDLDGNTRPWYLASEEKKLSQEQLNPNTYTEPEPKHKIHDIDAEIQRLKALIGGKYPDFPSEHEKSLEKSHNSFFIDTAEEPTVLRSRETSGEREDPRYQTKTQENFKLPQELVEGLDKSQPQYEGYSPDQPNTAQPYGSQAYVQPSENHLPNALENIQNSQNPYQSQGLSPREHVPAQRNNPVGLHPAGEYSPLYSGEVGALLDTPSDLPVPQEKKKDNRPWWKKLFCIGN